MLSGPGGNLPQGPGQGWRAAASRPDLAFELNHYARLAGDLEAAGIDFLFAPDALSLPDLGDGTTDALDRSTPLFPEPMTLMTALAATTSRIGLVPTVSTTFSEPYDVARRLATLDHLTHGRVGWNAVGSRGAPESANFAHRDPAPVGQRSERLEEFIEVVDALWGSWRREALVLDKQSGVALSPDLITTINHQGRHFDVAGPLNVPLAPQERAVTFLAGAGSAFLERAARLADVVFTQTPTRAAAESVRLDLDRACSAIGRDPKSILLVPGLNWLLADSDQEARDVHEQRYGGVEESDRPGAGHASVIGTPDDFVAMLRQWSADGFVDGFILIPYEVPRDYDTVLDLVSEFAGPIAHPSSSLCERLSLERGGRARR